MSIFTLLVLTSLVAAVAFFLAGYLLRPGGSRVRATAETATAPDDELARLREEKAALETALLEARRQHEETKASTHVQPPAVALAPAPDPELANARAEIERLSAKERKLAERLRAAEEHSRVAFEQEESNAAAFQAQFEAMKAERQHREEGLRKELEKARADLLAKSSECAHLTQSLHAQQTKAAKLEQSISQGQTRQRELDGQTTEARRQELEQSKRMATEADARARAAEVRASELESKQQAAAARSAVLEERERAAQAKLAVLEKQAHEALARAERAEAATQSQVSMDSAAVRAMRAEVGEERAKVEEERRRGQAATAQAESLAVALRAAEETLTQERAQAQAAVDNLRTAQAQRAEVERLAQDNAELRAKQAEAEREARLVASREGEVRDAKVELAAAQAKLVEMQRTLDENRRLRDEVSELRAHAQASEELDRLTSAHKQLRLDAELMARRLQEMKLDQAELVPLRAQAAEAASLAEEVTYLRRREKDLEAQLYANGFYASREMPAVSGELLAQAPVSDMETNLHALVGEGGPRTAVLADAQGFLIASAGESVAQEGLAAFAAVAGEMVTRARALLPLAEVDSVRVVDHNSMVLTCHLFESAGEGLGIATLGPGEPRPEHTARAVAELAAIVSGGESDPVPGETVEP